RATASGTCSGSFRDRRGATHQLSDGGLRFVETSLAENSSCAGGTANGRATLRFAYGKIHAAFHEVRAGGAVVITLTGANSGSAIAPAAVSPSENPVSILQRCASTGLDSVSLVAESSTAPSISG